MTIQFTDRQPPWTGTALTPKFALNLHDTAEPARGVRSGPAFRIPRIRHGGRRQPAGRRSRGFRLTFAAPAC